MIQRIIKLCISVLDKTIPALSGWLAYQLFFLPIPRPYKREEKEYLKRFTQSTFQLDNRDVTYYSINRAPYTLFCHGWSGNSMQFIKLIDQSLGQDKGIILMDMPAHGRSRGFQTDAVAFSNAIEHMLNAFDINHVICHSLSGLSLSLALNRGCKVPEKAAFISTTTSTNDILAFFLKQISGDYKTRERLVYLLQRRFNRSFNDFNAAEILTNTEKLPQAIVVVDDSDPQVKVQNGEQLAEALNAKMYVSHGLGHNRILKDNQVVSELMLFFNEN